MKTILICISTICGRISPGTGLGSSEDRKLLEEMRGKTDASLIGANTLRHGDPEMRGIAGVLDNERIRAIITASGNISAYNKKIFTHGPPPVVFTARAKVDALQESLGNAAHVIGLPIGPYGLSIQSVVHELAEMEVNSLLLEGGGRLNYAALQEGIVDEIYLTIAPKLSGDHNAAFLVDGPKPLGNPYVNLKMLSCRISETGEIFMGYEVKKTED